MKFLYKIFIYCYPFLANLISFKNKKAKLWVEGRRNIFEKLQTTFSNNNNYVVWIHCSSLGEFEQGRPIIEHLKKKYSNHKILLTFFSPSGYEVRKNYESADYIFYLPMDSKINASKFLDIVKPQLAVFIKYDFWHYYFSETKKRNIPLLVVSAVFRQNQIFFKWHGNFYKEILKNVTHFFVQDEKSVQLLSSINIQNNVSIAGDTRFDRVIKIANEFTEINSIQNFIDNNICIVAGSTWQEDDEVLAHFVNTNKHIKFIIAPHDIDEERLKETKTFYKNSLLFSSWQNLNKENNTAATKPNCLIIDNIGMLSKLYKYATICYVGGAFGNDGVHNVLEAAVFYKPVIFGPEYEKYNEAKLLIEQNGAISINNALELEEKINKILSTQNLYKEMCNNAGKFVLQNGGATEKIINYIQEKRLLTN